MLDTRIDTIIYQSQVYYTNLVNSLTTSKSKGKALDAKWRKADTILGYLEALNSLDYLLAHEDTEDEDIDNVNYILNCLIQLCDIYTYPYAAPITFQPAPDVLYGRPGTPGIGTQGDRGDTGLATDFQVLNTNISIAVDSFPIADANGARWDYWIRESGGASRVGSVMAVWSTDGTLIDFHDTSTPDIGSSTSALEFEVQYSSGNIYLVAVISSGTWSIRGSRYFIPNNGNGTGPINAILPFGYIYIGDSSNVAAPKLMSGQGTMDANGIFTLATNIITNSHITAGAAISLSKLEGLTADRIVITNGSGVLSAADTATYPNLTELSYVKGASSNLQTQIAGKLTDPMTTIGDIIIRNAGNNTVRLPIGSPNQVLTVVGGVPTWATPSAGFADPMTTSGDIIIRSGGSTVRLGIGSVGQVLTVSGGLPSWQTPTSYSDPLTTDGDLLRRASGSTQRYAIGTTNQVLSVVGGLPTWATIPVGATNELQKNAGSGLFGTTNAFVTSTGLGINNAAPAYQLDVAQGAVANSSIRIRTTDTGTVNLLLSRSAGTASDWLAYLPTASTDFRLYSGADRFTFTTAGLFVATNLQATGLTAGRVPFVSTGGLIVDEAGFTYSSPDLFAGHLNAGTGANGIELLSTGYLQPYGTNVNLNIVGFSGTIGSNSGGNLLLLAGNAYAASGSGTGGNITIKAGAKGPSGGTNGTIQIGDKTKVTYLDSGLNTSGSIYSGYFNINIPIALNVTDLDTFGDGQYMRVGNVVTCSGVIGIEPSVAFGALITVYIDLPIATTLPGVNRLAGTAVGVNGAGTDPSPGMIDADTVGNRARLQFRAYDTADRSWSFHFTYLLD